MGDHARSVSGDLRSWAAGSYALEAAVELLIRAFQGRFASPSMPWIEEDDLSGKFWLNCHLIAPNFDAYSGGERRVLTLVQALASDGMWLDLGSIVAGLDRQHTTFALAAIAHAAGSHRQYVDWTLDDVGGSTDATLAPSLVPWPRDDLSEAGNQ